MKYERPTIEIVEADFSLLAASGPGAGDIGSPSVRTKSVWDEVNEQYNNKEEIYEDWN